jgi:hypothetical protein
MAPSPAPSQPQHPGFPHFHYGQTTVRCSPVWFDSGGVATLWFPCPRCGQAISFRGHHLHVVRPDHVTVHAGVEESAIVRCRTRGCGWRATIIEGAARDA